MAPSFTVGDISRSHSVSRALSLNVCQVPYGHLVDPASMMAADDVVGDGGECSGGDGGCEDDVTVGVMMM